MRIDDFLPKFTPEVTIRRDNSISRVFYADGLSIFICQNDDKVIASVSNKCDGVLSFSASCEDGILLFSDDVSESSASDCLELILSATKRSSEEF